MPPLGFKSLCCFGGAFWCVLLSPHELSVVSCFAPSCRSGHLSGDKLQIPPPGLFEPILGSLGQITVHWALLEHALGATSFAIFTHVPEALGHQFPPRELSKKTSFVKEAVQTNGKLRKFKNFGTSLMNDIEASAQDRNFLIHGYIDGFILETEQTTFSRTDMKGIKPKKAKRLYSFYDIRKIAEDSLSLAQRTNMFANSVLQEFVPEDERNDF